MQPDTKSQPRRRSYSNFLPVLTAFDGFKLAMGKAEQPTYDGLNALKQLYELARKEQEEHDMQEDPSERLAIIASYNTKICAILEQMSEQAHKAAQEIKNGAKAHGVSSSSAPPKDAEAQKRQEERTRQVTQRVRDMIVPALTQEKSISFKLDEPVKEAEFNPIE